MFKTDDDTVVNFNLLQALVDSEKETLANLADKRRIYGKVIRRAHPKREKESKW